MENLPACALKGHVRTVPTLSLAQPQGLLTLLHEATIIPLQGWAEALQRRDPVSRENQRNLSQPLCLSRHSASSWGRTPSFTSHLWSKPETPTGLVLFSFRRVHHAAGLFGGQDPSRLLAWENKLKTPVFGEQRPLTTRTDSKLHLVTLWPVICGSISLSLFSIT
jgi:hypothetical protein